MVKHNKKMVKQSLDKILRDMEILTSKNSEDIDHNTFGVFHEAYDNLMQQAHKCLHPEEILKISSRFEKSYSLAYAPIDYE